MRSWILGNRFRIEIDADDVEAAATDMNVQLTHTPLDVLKDIASDYDGSIEFKDHRIMEILWDWLYDTVKLYERK